MQMQDSCLQLCLLDLDSFVHRQQRDVVVIDGLDRHGALSST
jgi:hypothetical protein